MKSSCPAVGGTGPIHALVSEGVFTKEGEFNPLPGFDRGLERAAEETFLRLLLTRLHRKERLSARFLDSLLPRPHSGFSVFARQHIRIDEPERLSHMARYLVRRAVSGRGGGVPEGES